MSIRKPYQHKKNGMHASISIDKRESIFVDKYPNSNSVTGQYHAYTAAVIIIDKSQYNSTGKLQDLESIIRDGFPETILEKSSWKITKQLLFHQELIGKGYTDRLNYFQDSIAKIKQKYKEHKGDLTYINDQLEQVNSDQLNDHAKLEIINALLHPSISLRETSPTIETQAFIITNINYDTELLNHPEIMKALTSKYGASKAINITSLLSPELVREAIETNNNELVLAGADSLFNSITTISTIN